MRCKVGGLATPHHDERRETLAYLASAGFLPSNSLNEPIINPYRNVENYKILRCPSICIEDEVSGDGFWITNEQ